MLLTFNNNLLAAIYKPVSSFGGEVLVRQEMFPFLNLLCRARFLIFRESVLE